LELALHRKNNVQWGTALGGGRQMALQERLSRNRRVCLDRQFLLFLLEKELSRSERYNHFVSFLLFRIEGLPKKEQASALGRLAKALAKEVRDSDYLGTTGKETLGVIVPYASFESAPIVLKRLRSESLLCLSQIHRKLDLKTSFAVYPTEADSLDTLVDLALRRLRR